jgi:hypothetical protein
MCHSFGEKLDINMAKKHNPGVISTKMEPHGTIYDSFRKKPIIIDDSRSCFYGIPLNSPH